MTHEVIRFVDESGNVKVGAREQGESSAHLLAVENLAELLTLEKSTLLSTITEALQSSETAEVARLLPPVDALTEVWAAGVTYKRSRAAREEERGGGAREYEEAVSRSYASETARAFPLPPPPSASRASSSQTRGTRAPSSCSASSASATRCSATRRSWWARRCRPCAARPAAS